MASYGSVLFLSIPLSVAVSVGLWSMAYGVLWGEGEGCWSVCVWLGEVVEVVGLQLKCPFCKAHHGEFTLLFLPCILKENLFVQCNFLQFHVDPQGTIPKHTCLKHALYVAPWQALSLPLCVGYRTPSVWLGKNPFSVGSVELCHSELTGVVSGVAGK